MDTRHPRRGASLVQSGRAAAMAVLLFAALNWVGWATGIDGLTRVYHSWPRMLPWTGLWLAVLAAASLLQSGQPSHIRVWLARGLSLAMGTGAVVVLVEYATGRSLGLDTVWFAEALGAVHSAWPGRPSPQTAACVVCLAAAIALTRSDWLGTRVIWLAGLLGAGLIAVSSLVAFMFGARALMYVVPHTGMAISTALAVLLLVVAAQFKQFQRHQWQAR